MSKRSEELALKYYPKKVTEYDSYFGHVKIDVNLPQREALIRGYELAQKDINKELMDKMAELREKQEKALLSDLDYDIRIDPAKGFDQGSVSVYQDGKLVGQFVEPKEELTWEDIRTIKIIVDQLTDAINSPKLDSPEFYAEVLRRFKEVNSGKAER